MKTDKNRQYYEDLFANHPDVVDTEAVRVMLGGVGINTVWKLIKSGKLQHINLREQRLLVPKDWLIDFMLGEHYAKIIQ